MRLSFGFRVALYAVFAVLFTTGIGWLIIDQFNRPAAGSVWQAAAPYLLMVHGGAAMLTLLLLGALFPLHARSAWRARKNRASGIVMLGSNAVLIVTAFGLYYFGSELLRRWTSDVHILIGLGFPAIMGIHAVLGLRSRGALKRPAPPQSLHCRAPGGRSHAQRRSGALRCL